jgi:hypothetical protein
VSRTKNLKGECQHCGRPIEFPAEIIGTQAPCPSCGQQTELMLAIPPEEPAVPRRITVLTVSAIVVLVLGLVVTLVGLKRAERRMANHNRQPAATAPATNQTNADLETGKGSPPDSPK